MKLSRTYGRVAMPFGFALLAACQTAPVDRTAANENTTTAAPAVAAPTAVPDSAAHSAPTAVQATHQGAPVAIFLAARQIQPGWTPVPAPSGTLYVNPQPFLTRNDLSEVKAGGTDQGQGWLVLGLNPAGAEKARGITSQNPGKGLALVIGRTMMPLMIYNAPITDGRLVFYISNQENAVAAARAIAGVKPDPGATAVPQSAPQPSMDTSPATTSPVME